MAYIFAMSDIHGCLEALNENLQLIDLNDLQNKLILCGDFIDYGKKSCETIHHVRQLTKQYPDQVIALRGNHEQMFLDFLSCSKKDVWNFEWLSADRDFDTVRSFISDDLFKRISAIAIMSKDAFAAFMKIAELFKQYIQENHCELIQWLKALPYYYEMETQIFVHAGIDEEAEEYWMHGTSPEYFTSKYPATFGTFYKDIIAGHISTSSLKKKRDFHDVFWDGKSHYFLDGSTAETGMLPLLRYDTKTKEYHHNKNGRFQKILVF
ncbi:serine/threonine protein phosphatase [Acetobacterium fimetarium]|uniref:Serine/threonine protein phosphatase n=1 Tax=Acetobacterium fimetarium TaxID=52691 RepID=A0ABR6WV03_9FIRM|nr:metallophosphoesterase [Acetobacterium fimetarium]MBC3804046.1 serine/threonine protein phosphatase [Acetobacterium fimetarium]